jgi:hypothetical protein
VAIRKVCLLNEIKAAEDVGDVVETADLGLEAVLVDVGFVHQTPSRRLKRHHATLGMQEEAHELLTEHAQRFVPSRRPLASRCSGLDTSLSLVVATVGVIVVALIILGRAKQVLPLQGLREPRHTVPMVTVLGLSRDNFDGFEHIDYVVDSPSFNSQPFRSCI